jgi:Cu/Zn superoxide dismutase
MDRVDRLAGTVLGAALVVCVILLGERAVAQEAESVQVHLTPSRDSGVSGTATLTDVEDGVKVELNMQDLPEAGVKHINHIHGGGTCADDRAGRTAPVTIPLDAIVANADGTGSAITTVKVVTLDELLADDQDRFILLHDKVKEGQGIPPGISCADLPQGSANTTLETLPSSGGLRPAILLCAAALASIAGFFALRMIARGLHQ